MVPYSDPGTQVSRMETTTKERDAHLDMALLQPPLDVIDGGDIEAVLRIGDDNWHVIEVLDAGGIEGFL